MENKQEAIENRVAMHEEIRKAHESYYSVDHSPGGVSFLEYLAMHLSGAGYRLPVPDEKQGTKEKWRPTDWANPYCETCWFKKNLKPGHCDQCACIFEAGADEMYISMLEAGFRLPVPDEKRREQIVALEARIADMKAGKLTYCAYCGEEFPIDAAGTPEAVSNHIQNCPKHPIQDYKAEIERLGLAIQQARAEVANEFLSKIWIVLSGVGEGSGRISNENIRQLKARYGQEEKRDEKNTEGI